MSNPSPKSPEPMPCHVAVPCPSYFPSQELVSNFVPALPDRSPVLTHTALPRTHLLALFAIVCLKTGWCGCWQILSQDCRLHGIGPLTTWPVMRSCAHVHMLAHAYPHPTPPPLPQLSHLPRVWSATLISSLCRHARAENARALRKP